MTNHSAVEVIVVGAGPVGLLVASELALAGVRVQVLERRQQPDPTVKAGSINVATAEVLDRRGLLEAAREVQRRTTAEIVRFAPELSERMSSTPAGFPVAGHFAGMFFRPDLVDQSAALLSAHSGVSDAVLVPQRDLEALLAEHANRLGVEVVRGVEVTALTQDDSGVTLSTPSGPRHARWVVGADGGRSRIRKLAGIGFEGTDPEITGYQAIADIDGAEPLGRGWTWTPTGVYCHGPVPGRILTVQFTGPPADRDAPVTLDEVQASVRLVSGVDVTLTALHGAATRWTDNARQATTYRAGRVLLAGDAAHVHSPFSGQGLNLGVGDAVNLGWKLAATIRGWGPEGLLDTYTAERQPIGAWVLDWTRAQVALMRGDAKTAQLRMAVEQQLLDTPQSMTRLVALTSGVAQHYPDHGTATVETSAGDERPAATGRLLGDVALADGTRLADHAHGGRFLLLDRTPDQQLSRAVGAWSDRVDVVADPRVPLVEPVGLLVRPDGVIAWVQDGRSAAGAARTDSLTAALLRWAGAPAAVRASA